MTAPLPLAAFDQAFPPTALCYPDANPLTGQAIMRFNVYQGGVRLVDYFAAAVAGYIFTHLEHSALPVTEDVIENGAETAWRIAAAMVRTRPGNPPKTEKGGAP